MTAAPDGHSTLFGCVARCRRIHQTITLTTLYLHHICIPAPPVMIWRMAANRQHICCSSFHRPPTSILCCFMMAMAGIRRERGMAW